MKAFLVFCSLIGKVNAKAVGAGKLVHVAGPIWAVLELIRRVQAVFVAVTHKV